MSLLDNIVLPKILRNRRFINNIPIFKIGLYTSQAKELHTYLKTKHAEINDSHFWNIAVTTEFGAAIFNAIYM